ncbi:DUF1343 domain-containing protein [Bacteroidales bacterium OttesenSCG-928-B11]|nr:DUF1343 domain-containing protein [Bacteroidales bacterium OttesenSCG-928-C03]MDL2312099.1 DUF1343 domain-containing protein [Bacteroidales bacterium OttesenSCG-928-B11]MDL2326071.1 DUF1343 domain-containing protein [Bacteroidales bacterium OttesenSCG-928-A14]
MKYIVCLLLLSFSLGCANGNPPLVASHESEKENGRIVMGAERFDVYLPLLQDKRVGICGNFTSRVGSTHLVDTLLAKKVNLVKIFCPEHGFRGEAEAGAHIASSKDEKTGLPIVSLYGNNKKPKAEQISDLDVIIFDIQDVGCRFYTYISTLHYVMESAAENGVEVIVFDRPNPNGYFVDGPVLEMKYHSFVGMHPIPVVHGMTIGEYAKMINGEGWLANKTTCKLTVIAMENYTHNSRYSLPYPPSPNLQTDEAIYLYPSLCLFEGTPVSVGRGTTKPFQVFGHPLLTAGDFYFTPNPIKGVAENPPQKGKKCRGYDLTNEALNNLNGSNSFSIKYIITAYQHFPKSETFFTNKEFFDKLAGKSTLRQQIVDGLSEEQIRDSWKPELEAFKKMRKQYLLYADFE